MPKQLLAIGLLLALSTPTFAGTISMSSMPYPDSVVVEVTIEDTGGAEGCPYIGIWRDGVVVFYIERQIGTTITRRFVDTNVERNTLYCYTPDLSPLPDPNWVCLESICFVFDCFYQMMTCVNTGPDPAFIGRGFLSEFYPGGGEVDHNETVALLYDCDPTRFFLGLHHIPAEAEQYLDSGESVAVYGGWFCCWAQGVWLLNAEIVVPRSCVIAVEETTWGRVKSLYRD